MTVRGDCTRRNICEALVQKLMENAFVWTLDNLVKHFKCPQVVVTEDYGRLINVFKMVLACMIPNKSLLLKDRNKYFYLNNFFKNFFEMPNEMNKSLFCLIRRISNYCRITSYCANSLDLVEKSSRYRARLLYKEASGVLEKTCF